MKILVISFSLSSGGAERFAVDLCNSLTGKHEVVMLTTDDDSVAANAYYRNELAGSVKYINLAAGSGHSAAALFGMFFVIQIQCVVFRDAADIRRKHGRAVRGDAVPYRKVRVVDALLRILGNAEDVQRDLVAEAPVLRGELF